jgi:phage-related protein
MMGETFKFAAPLAAALGYNMEDVAVATGIMANSGIKATMAGTSLRAIFTRLSTGTGEAGAALKGLGIDLEDGEGNMKSWLTVMDELRGSFGHLRIPINELNAELNKLDSALEDGEMSEEDFNEAQEKLIRKAYGAEGAMKAQYASMLAGKNGLSGFLALVNSSEDDFDKLTNAIYNSDGAAAEMASVMRDNLQGSLTLLSSAFDGFKKSIYEGFSAPMNDLVKSITNNIMPALQGVVDGVPGSSDKLTDAISNFINNSLKDAAKILPEAVNVIGTVAGSIGEAAVRNMPEFIRNGVSLIEQIVDGIVKASPDIVKGIGKFIAEATKGAGDLLVHLADTVVDTLPDFIDAIFAVSPKIIDSIIRVTQKIAEALPEILEKIIDAIPDAIDGIMEFIGTQTPKLVEAVIQIVTGLVEALPSIVQHLVDAVPPIIATLTKMLPELFKDLTIAIVENAPALVRALIQLTVEVTKMLPDIVMPIIRMMPELTVAMAQAVVESAPEVVKAFGEMFTDVANSLPALFGAVVTAFVGFRDDIAAALAGAWTEAETAASGAWDNIKQGASDAVDNVGKFFSGMWDNIKKTVSEAGSKIGETLGDTIKEGVNGVLEFVENGINNIPDAINGAIDLINNLPGVEISPIDRIKLPRLAKGAVVDKPTIAQIGEAGKEAIIPLERNKQGLREIAQAIRSEIDSMRQMQPITNTIDRGTTINLTQNNTSPKALSTYEIWRQSRNMLRLVKAQGGV